MPSSDLPGGTYRVAGLELTRVGFGAMQLAGPGVFGQPQDRDAAIAVLRAAVDFGIRHIVTATSTGRASRTSTSGRRSHPGRAARAGARQPAAPGARRD